MLRIFYIVIAFFTFSSGWYSAVAETEAEEAEPQTSEGLELPVTDPDYSAGHFETGLWPVGIVRDLEVEHIKFLATSPETPVEDRAMYLEVVKNLTKSRFNGPGF